VGLVAPLLASGAGTPADAAGDKGWVDGGITCPKLSTCPSLKLMWFDKSWNYIGQKKLGKGVQGYSLSLPAGAYHLQFVDQRASYDLTKYAPTDVQVTIEANRASGRNVTMRKGAAITGTAVNGQGKPLRSATLTAANTGQQSFSTTANRKGQFAIGGLPEGKYSVFTFDKSRTWVGESAWAGAVKAGKTKDIRVRLTKRAGQLDIRLTSPSGLLKAKTTLTITSKKTGQWWSVTSGSGMFAFTGLYPGGYTAQFNGAGVWLPKTGAVQGSDVRSGGFDTGEFHLTKRGGWLTGTVVDSSNPDIALEGAVVQLYNQYGVKLDETTSGAGGEFKLDGQLTTQNGMSLVVEPGPYTDYLGTTSQRCQYTMTDYSGVAVTTGQQSALGPIGIERLPDGNCQAPDPGDRRSVSR